MLVYLQRHQRELQHLHTSPSEYHYRQGSLFEHLRTLEVYANNSHASSSIFIDNLLRLCSGVERLSLGLRPSWTGTDQKNLCEWIPNTRFRHLKELSLFELPLRPEISLVGLLRKIDFRTLEKLTLSDCDDTDEFFYQLGKEVDNAPLSLRHMAVSVENGNCLVELLDSCKALTDLHVRSFEWPPVALLAWLNNRGSTLRTVALHLDQDDLYYDPDPFPIRAYKSFSKPSRLRYLGFQISHYDLHPGELHLENRHYDYLVCIGTPFAHRCILSFSKMSVAS